MKRVSEIVLSLSTMFGTYVDHDIATHITAYCDATTKNALHCTSKIFYQICSYNNLSNILNHNQDALTQKEKEYALLWATQRSHHNTVKRLLKNGTNPNADNRLHLSPLTIALNKNDKSMIALLKQYSATINVAFKSPPTFVIATYTRDAELLQSCIKCNGYNPHYTFNTPCIEKKPHCNGDKQNILHLAAYIGDANILTILLAQPEIFKKINTGNDHCSHDTPYWIASHKKYTAFMETLITHGADIIKKSADGHSPIGAAAFNGHTNLVKLLTSHKSYTPDTIDTHTATPLYLAVQNNHIEIAQIFLSDPKVNVNYINNENYTPLYIASSKGYTDMVEILLNHPDIKTNIIKNPSPLYVACQNGHFDCVKKLCLANPDLINIDDLSSIWAALKNQHLEIVKYLLTYKLIYTNIIDIKGRTLLHLCATCDDPEVIILLLNHSPYLLNLCDYTGNSPLWYASKKGNTAMVEILLKTQIKLACNPHDCNKNNVTPLDVAANNDIKELLIKFDGKTGKDVQHQQFMVI